MGPCAGTLSWLPSVVANQVGTAVSDLLKSLLSSSPSSESTPVTKFRRAGDLLDALRLHTAADQQLLATAVAGPIAAALVGSVQQGNAPPEAASLLASLVKQFGAEVMRAAPAVALPGAGRTTGTVLLEFLKGSLIYRMSWTAYNLRAVSCMPGMCHMESGQSKDMVAMCCAYQS